MIKRFLSLLFVIFLSAVMAGPVYARVISSGFSDTKISANNNFSTSILDFSLKDTSDNPLISPFFNITNMKPGDSHLQTVRVKKDPGSIDFKYEINFLKTSGENNLCDALQLKASLNGVDQFNGNLSDFNMIHDVAIGPSGQNDWDFTISLSNTADSLKNKTCGFNLVFKGYQADSDGAWGFFDSHSLANNVATGAWTETGLMRSLMIGPTLPTEPEIELNISADLETLSFKVININNFKILSYELTYDADLAPQGIMGSLILDNQNEYIKNNIILGSCSTDGKCTYDTGIKNMKLKVTLTDEDGNKTVLEKLVP